MKEIFLQKSNFRFRENIDICRPLRRLRRLAVEYVKKEMRPCVATSLQVPCKEGITLHDFELTTTCDGPHDTEVVTTSCSVRPSAMPSVTIL